MESGKQTNGLNQTGIPSIKSEAREDPGIVHRAREVHVDIQKVTLLLPEGLKLDEV